MHCHVNAAWLSSVSLYITLQCITLDVLQVLVMLNLLIAASGNRQYRSGFYPYGFCSHL